MKKKKNIIPALGSKKNPIKVRTKDVILSKDEQGKDYPIQRYYYDDKPCEEKAKTCLNDTIDNLRNNVKKMLQEWGAVIKKNGGIYYPKNYKEHEEIYGNDLSDLYHDLNFFKNKIPKNKNDFFDKVFKYGQKYMKCVLYMRVQRKNKGDEFDSKEWADVLEELYKEAEKKPDDYKSDKMRKNYAYDEMDKPFLIKYPGETIDNDTKRKYWKKHYPERFKK